MEPRPKITWEGGCCRVNCYLFSWTYSKQIACSLANIDFYESWLASSSWDHEKALLLFPLIPAPLCGPIAWKYLQMSICYLNLSLNAIVHQQVQTITLPKSFWDAQQLLSSSKSTPMHCFYRDLWFSGINTVVSEDSWDPDKSFKLEFKGKDENYGKPPEGSLTEARAKKACQHINKELSTLLSIIRGIGNRDEQTGEISVTFGKLFRYYIPISDKIVGLLLRARRWRLVDFTGEMLYQGQDDEKLVKLLISDEDIPYSRRFDFSLDQPQQNNITAYISNDSSEDESDDSSSMNLLKNSENLHIRPNKETDDLLQSR